MDMRFHWLHNRKLMQQLRFYWCSGKLNYANYFTKHHPAAHHRNMQKEFLTPQRVLQDLLHRTAAAAGGTASKEEAINFANSAVQIRQNIVNLIQANPDKKVTVTAHYCSSGSSLQTFAKAC